MDGEAARVRIEDLERVKSRNILTLLFDGWEDKVGRSLYGSVAAEIGEYPVVLSLDDMSGNRGSADKYLETAINALKNMGLEDGRNIKALTTDNPSVMQSFRRKFQKEFYWVLVFISFIFQCIYNELKFFEDFCVLSSWFEYYDWKNCFKSNYETSHS